MTDARDEKGAQTPASDARPGEVRAVRHAGLVVRDLERALSFYRDRLGLQVAARSRETGPFIEGLLGLPGVQVETVKLSTPDGETQVELLFFHTHPVPAPPPRPLFAAGPTHVALRVTGLDALHASLSRDGIRFIQPPATSPSGAARVAFCFDPEGIPLELVELL